MSIVTRVNSEEMKRAIRSFFLVDVSYKDTLLFYFSGHGVLDKFGNYYLASSEIDPKEPGTGGYWFDELDRVIENSLSRRKVVVLDCCYAGALGSIGLEKSVDVLKKGGEENAKKAAASIRNKIRSGTGKCILSAHSAEASENLYDSDGKEQQIYQEILEDCDGSVELAQSKSQAKNVYKYWKIQGVKGKSVTIHPEKYQLDLDKYRSVTCIKKGLWYTRFGTYRP